MSKSDGFRKPVSSPKCLANLPNILELWQKRPNTARSYISPTFAMYWDVPLSTGRVCDRGRARSIWKSGTDEASILRAIDLELGLEWPDWRHDDKAEQRAYTAQRNRLR